MGQGDPVMSKPGKKWLGFIIFFLGVTLTGTVSASEVLRGTLKNGLQVVVVQNRLAPVATTMVNYRVGSNEAPEGFPGMAHAQEHMMFRGGPGLTAEQLANIIAFLGGSFNANTQPDLTQYYFTVPAEDLELALRIEAQRMRAVFDSDELWERERGAIEQEVAQDYSNPKYLFYKRLLARMFAGTPYAYDALGTRSSFKKTTGAMLKQFHESWYGPNNALLVIVGDVDLKKTMALVEALFADLPARPTPPRSPVTLAPLKPEKIRLESDLPYVLAVVAYRLPGYNHPDFAAGQVLADILDSQRGNLYALVPRGQALSAGFSTTLLAQAGMGYAMAAIPQGGDGSALIRRMKAVIGEYLSRGFPEDLVAASKRREIAAAELQKNSIEGLAAVWSQALALEGRRSPEEDLEAIKKVGVDDVNRVARSFLVNETAITALLTPRPSGKAVSTKPFHGKESFAPKETKEVPLPEWAQKALTPPTLPKSHVHPQVFLLSNGLRLIVQPEKISRTISLFGRVKTRSELQTPQGKEGVAELLEDLFSYGSVNLDRLAFQKAADDIAADIDGGAKFSLQVLSEHFDRAVQLLADNLLHPALPASAFKVVKRESISLVKGKRQSPGYKAGRALLSGLYPARDPLQREVTPRSLASLSLQDARDYYKKTFRPDQTTMVIVGDVTPEEARTTITKYFGSWQARGPRPNTDLPPAPPNRGSQILISDAGRVQDEVILAQTLGLTRSAPDYYALQVGNAVLSGAFYATRLYRDLREKAGLVYSVESEVEANKTRGLFQVSYACDPPQVFKARTMVVENLKKMQTGLITPDELRQAKTLLVRQVTLTEAGIDGIGGRLLELSGLDLPLDEPLKAAGRYLETSAEEVRGAFARWIRPRDLVQITLGAKPR
jgi:zinc protease